MRSSLFTSEPGPRRPRRGKTLDPVVLSDGRSVPIEVRRHPRAKRYVLRVSAGVIQLTIPTRGRLYEADAWVRTKTRFISEQIASEAPPVPFEIGRILPVLGDDVLISKAAGQRSALRGRELLIADGDQDQVAKRARRVLRKAALEAATNDLQEAWSALAVEPAEVRVREMRSRWGSCGSDGRTFINWRLIFAPRDVLRSVAVHEAAHRLEMNHSPQFWQHVHRMMPDYAEHHEWLKAEGRTLFAYGAKI